MPDTLFLLQNNRIFKHCLRRGLQQIAPIFERRYYPRGARIARKEKLVPAFIFSSPVRPRYIKKMNRVKKLNLIP
jgi:hypothetical protein